MSNSIKVGFGKCRGGGGEGNGDKTNYGERGLGVKEAIRRTVLRSSFRILQKNKRLTIAWKKKTLKGRVLSGCLIFSNRNSAFFTKYGVQQQISFQSLKKKLMK